MQLARELATSLASDGQRVKVSVQQALGAGVFQARPSAHMFAMSHQTVGVAGLKVKYQRFHHQKGQVAGLDLKAQGGGHHGAQGMPLSLSGVRRIMERMDWGDAGAFVGFGEVGADQVTADCDFYILIAPQNVVGARLGCSPSR